MVRGLTREVSNHTPMLLNSNESSFMATQPMFKFELVWLLQDSFMETVRDIWTKRVVGCTPMERWQGMQYLRGWEKT
jgi:hypothetical protein